MIYSRYWRIGLILLVVGLLAFGANPVGLGGEVEPECIDLWAANADGEKSYIPGSGIGEGINWATFIKYDEDFLVVFHGNPASLLLNQQGEQVGVVVFGGSGNEGPVTLTIMICPEKLFWPYGTNVYVQGYDRQPRGNPILHRFEYQFEFPQEEPLIVDFAEYYGIHVKVMEK